MILQRTLILAFSSLIILTSAASCTIPGFPGTTNTQTQRVLGVLKQDPSARSEGFGRINAVKTLTGETDSQGLSTLSGVKLSQVSKESLYLLIKNRGFFKTENGGRLWTRQYIFELSQNQNAEQRQAENNDILNRNNQIQAADFVYEAQKPEVIYISGKYENSGKIYKTTDGGKQWNELYTGVGENVSISRLALNPNNSLKVYAITDGGVMIRSVDGGSTWSRVQAFNDTPLNFGFAPDGTFYAFFRRNGLFISRDEGATWTKTVLNRTETNTRTNVDTVTDSVRTVAIGDFEKIVPVSVQKGSWLLIAGRQLWYTEGLDKPFTKLVLPAQSERYNIADITSDPVKGLDRILLSIDGKLFETTNRGASWSVNDKIGLSTPIGNIGSIVIDRTDNRIIYLMLTDTRSTNFNPF